MDAFTQLAGEAIAQYGYIGLLVCLILNCLGVPIASEVLLPLSGWAVHLGHLNFVLVFIVAMIGQSIGFVVAYGIAAKDGIPLLEKYGKYIFIRHQQIAQMQARMKRNGKDVEIIGLVMPGVHGYMGYVGGIGNMSFGVFLPLMLIGTAIWTAALMALGYFAGSKLATIGGYSKTVSWIAMIMVVVALIIWYSRRYWPNSRRTKR